MKVLTVGTFDPLHDGHRDLFADMRLLAGPNGSVIVGVNGDTFYRRYRQTEPFQTATTRLVAVASDPSVDLTYINDDADVQTVLIEAHAPDILIVGLDWAHDGYLTQIGAPNWDWFRDRGIIVTFTPRHGDISSTELRRASSDSATASSTGS